jgi:nucleotide-binding universal stress UspA family protein
MKRIVVGIDDSPGARAALRWALDLAPVVGAEVEAVLVYNFELAWVDVGSDYQATWMQHAATRAQEKLRGFIDEAAPEPRPVPIRPLVVEGTPAAALIAIAEHADLLVVGSRGRGGFVGLLLGSVSQRCVEHAHCPVVVVPTPE